MHNHAASRFLALSAAAAILVGCTPKDSTKPDGQAAAVEPSAATPGGNGVAKPQAASGKPKLKGLDPTPPLSRTDRGNGLVIEDLKMGTGEIVWPGSRALMTIHGWSVATGKMYWDTPNQGGPRDIALSTAMKGMKEGIPGMRVGGKRRLSIPGDMAYGFKETKDEAGEILVPQLTPIVLEIEVVEVLSKLKLDPPSGAAADQPAGAAAPK